MKKIWKIVLVIIVVAGSVSAIILLLARMAPKPPVAEMEAARLALSHAVKSKADIYSRKLYSEAKSSFDSAMVNWQAQNERFIYMRDYDRVRSFAEVARKRAAEAAENSATNSSVLKLRIESRIDTLNKLVSEINKLFNAYPLEAETRNRISTGKMLLREAEIIYGNEQFMQADRKITESEYLLTTSYDNALENLASYFRAYSTWKKWADRTIKESRRNGTYSIIIDKFSRKLIIYYKGQKKYEFEAELGKNWVGDKRVRGDHATPEGMYKVIKKIDGGNTKYYKALLLDYPNEEDKARFREEIASGTLPKTAKIGGLIEIHGNGGKGIDWTEGCIALTDSEMDQIFKLVRGGTQVTIVGSLTDLPDIMN